MAIELDNSFTVPVPPEQAWDVLLDVERIAPCMPGASVTSVEGDEIAGQVKVKLGPLSLSYKGTAKFTEKDPATHTIAIEATGKETRGAGTASATVHASLKPDDAEGQTTVSIHTSLNVTGRPAQFGRSLLPEVSGKLIDQFAANLAALIDSTIVTVEPTGAPDLAEILTLHPVPVTDTNASDKAAVESGAVPRFSAPPPVILDAPSYPSSLKGLPGGPHKTPDTVLDGGDLDGLAVRGASLRGDDHRHAAVTRQDSMDICRVRGDKLDAVLGCVADGSGSQPLSQLGSAQACILVRDEVGERLSALFATDPERGLPAVCQDLAEHVAERLARRASFLKVNPRALSTTLAVAVVEAAAAEVGGTLQQRRWVAFAVGDATAFVLRDGTFFACFADPDGIANARTSFALPTSVGTVAATAGVLGPGDALVVCTDGLSDPMRNPQVKDQLAAWWGGSGIPTLPEFGWQMSFRIKTYGDDRTAVCFWAKLSDGNQARTSGRRISGADHQRE